MKDNDIIKALECCASVDDGCSTDCPLFVGDDSCFSTLLKPTLDLINRQKAEIEKLKEEFDVLDAECGRMEKAESRHYDDVVNAKSEAIKEFAERLKELKHECGCNYRKKPVYAVVVEKIDNLVKEMTEGSENDNTNL